MKQLGVTSADHGGGKRRLAIMPGRVNLREIKVPSSRLL
jgi:hypothetical protein